MKQALLVAVALLGACGEAASEEKGSNVVRPPLEPIALTMFEREAPATIRRVRNERAARDRDNRVKRALEPVLYDPFSLRLRNVRSGRNGATCGQVNAKNRLGAYVGFRDFVVGRDGQAVWVSDFNDGLTSDLFSGFAEAYANACASSSEARRYREANVPMYFDYYTDTSNAM
jgi:hypothetical protein